MTFLEANEAFRAVDDLIESIGGLTDDAAIFAAARCSLAMHDVCHALEVAVLSDDCSHLVVREIRHGDNNGRRPDADEFITSELSIAGSVPEQVMGSGEPIWWDLTNPLNLSAVGPDWAETHLAIRKAGMVSGVAVPLHASGVAVGAVTFLRTDATRFGDLEVEALQRVGDILSMAIEKSRLITELRQQIDIVNNNNERLESSNQDLEDFAYVASHDLQEPLRKIRAFSDRLATKAADRLTEQEREYINRMQSAALRMNTLISDLLDFSRVNTRGDNLAPVDANRIVALAIDACSKEIEACEGVVDVGVLPTVTADNAQLLQVFVALIDNAIKFRNLEVAPHVQINVVDDGDAAFDTLVVADNGIGFAPKYLDRIFKPFQRLNGREQYPGSGIGLAVCRRVAERHDGTIDATSIEGTGSRFVLRIPRSSTDSSEGSGQ